MVIFHSYVSLPEGRICVVKDKAWRKQILGWTVIDNPLNMFRMDGVFLDKLGPFVEMCWVCHITTGLQNKVVADHVNQTLSVSETCS